MQFDEPTQESVRADAATRLGGDERKPRIALMGEFSAGKSTLSNLLIGEPALPTKVTATQLPPVWISHGEGAPYQVDLDGNESPVDIDDIPSISPVDVQYIRVFHESEALELCDVIDMPGISDPNMPPEVWERVMDLADGVVWCTHANQAWRQSEAAVWATFPEELYDKSLLLLTRFDKIINERDRQRVVMRVERETEGLFRGVFPISLVQALDAKEDFEKWQACGADAFASALVDLANELSTRMRPYTRPGFGEDVRRTVTPRTTAPTESDPLVLEEQTEKSEPLVLGTPEPDGAPKVTEMSTPAPTEETTGQSGRVRPGRVVPRRATRGDGPAARRPRPSRDDADADADNLFT
ncbi:dynamin family protein [Pseudoruegeria sp. HB172150]|uniref:dynamin family protein n=1 Tax=Pseudoruegeria sp. HB172150 TaxID=2721164 RepID=UPI001554BCFF|nr:dynamin family protein [Pseudoruegeria sp. HB172150]